MDNKAINEALTSAAGGIYIDFRGDGYIAVDGYLNASSLRALADVLDGIVASGAVISVDVNGCARCGLDHPVNFKPFSDNPVGCDNETLTHWGLCPVNGEPILLTIRERAS